MKTPLALAALALVATAGCAGQQPTKGGLSAEEERRLDNAARMLDDMGNPPLDAPVDSNAAGNGSAGRTAGSPTA